MCPFPGGSRDFKVVRRTIRRGVSDVKLRAHELKYVSFLLLPAKNGVVSSELRKVIAAIKMKVKNTVFQSANVYVDIHDPKVLNSGAFMDVVRRKSFSTATEPANSPARNSNGKSNANLLSPGRATAAKPRVTQAQPQHLDFGGDHKV